jgi:hypothetical protein
MRAKTQIWPIAKKTMTGRQWSPGSTRPAALPQPRQMMYNKQIHFAFPMRIKVQSLLRRLFGQLDKGLQKILLADLGFLTLGSEERQLQYVQRILSMDFYRTNDLKAKLVAWHRSGEYRELLNKFDGEFRDKAVPEVRKAIKKTQSLTEDHEKTIAEEMIEKSLSDVND